MSDQLQAERERFEAALRRDFPNFPPPEYVDNSELSYYEHHGTQHMWNGWNAALSSSQQVREETVHASDCAVHNMPAMPNGDCDCTSSQPCGVAMTDNIGSLRGLVNSVRGVISDMDQSDERDTLISLLPLFEKHICALQSSPKGASTGTERDAGVVKDAERYRFLRNSRDMTDVYVSAIYGDAWHQVSGQVIDSFIDAAIARMRSEDGKGGKL